jgi:hypothetical protein
MPTRRERDQARAEKLAAEDPEWQKTAADIEARSGSYKLPKTWSKRELHVRAHEAVNRATLVLTEAVTEHRTLDLDEWARWGMAENLAKLRRRVAQVEERLGASAGIQVAVTGNGQPGTLDHGHTHACAACGRAFTGVRTDARYCSNRCRQRAYRERGGEA